MNNFNDIKNIINNLPTKKNGQYGKLALNKLEKEGLAYIDYNTGRASSLHDRGAYLGVCNFINSCQDFANKEDAHKVACVIIEHLNERGEALLSY